MQGAWCMWGLEGRKGCQLPTCLSLVQRSRMGPPHKPGTKSCAGTSHSLMTHTLWGGRKGSSAHLLCWRGPG